ncbi:MAG: RHS repeat-associated core domain-containing protein, partial [Sedimentisphaerales bacterium]|nr:RHS repeat-associated core domain-containing protein [Sedimentisphaerales bacterium]
IWANGELLMQHDGDMATGEKYFYLHDRLGSIRQVINDEGETENRYIYNPFGQALEDETEETIDNPFQFANYQYEPVTGMYYCNARWFDPAIYRFTGRDPVLGTYNEPLTLHIYLYCLNDPINNVDLTGMETGKIEEKVVTTGIGTSLQSGSAGFAMNIKQMVIGFVNFLNFVKKAEASLAANALRDSADAGLKAMKDIAQFAGRVGWRGMSKVGKTISKIDSKIGKAISKIDSTLKSPSAIGFYKNIFKGYIGFEIGNVWSKSVDAAEGEDVEWYEYLMLTRTLHIVFDKMLEDEENPIINNTMIN